jgi:hypothetical protein
MINKNLMLVAMLSMGTALTTFGKVKPTFASLTPPATYDYSYTWNAAASEQYLNVNGVDLIPLYTRTANGIYFNYTSTFNVIDGLDVTQTFNRSNTAWQSSGTFYKPDENKIGSSAAVNVYGQRLIDITYSNLTSKDYLLYLDISSSVDPVLFSYYTNGILWTNANGDTQRIYDAGLFVIYINSYTTFRMYSFGLDNDYYFDAWYLRDLGISEAYQQGLDAETDGILTDYLGTDAQQIGWVLIGIAAILFAFKGGK